MRTNTMTAALTLSSTNTVTTDAFTVEHMEGYSITFGTQNVSGQTSTAAGTVKLQASNNAYIDNIGVARSYPDPSAIWVDVPGSTNAVTSGANSVLYNTTGCYYRWVRVSYTNASGSGTGNVYAHAKGTQS